MSNRFELPRTPEDFFPIMEARFNSLDVEAALELFYQDSIIIDVAGEVHRGVAEIRSELKKYGDTALSICDWSYDGIAKDGATIKMNGSTSDVIRRCDDEVWRYEIDNPFGTQTRAAKVKKNTANK